MATNLLLNRIASIQRAFINAGTPALYRGYKVDHSKLYIQSTTKPLRTRDIEVECKFLPTATSLDLLRRNDGNPPFETFISLGKATIHDVYVDMSNVLMDSGIYVRRRNGAWEAKVRQSGDYENSCFTEYKDVNEITRLIQEAFLALVLPPDAIKAGSDLEITDLLEVANFETLRESWDLDGFRVVVDETEFKYAPEDESGFKHIVGEVELCERYQDDDEDMILSNACQAHLKMQKFMREHEWAFPTPRAYEKTNGMQERAEGFGKLSAYFRWLRRDPRSYGDYRLISIKGHHLKQR